MPSFIIAYWVYVLADIAIDVGKSF